MFKPKHLNLIISYWIIDMNTNTKYNNQTINIKHKYTLPNIRSQLSHNEQQKQTKHLSPDTQTYLFNLIFLTREY